MVETWDEGLEKILGKKRCCVCENELMIGKYFILKNRKFFHEECYRRKKADEIKNGKCEIDDLTEISKKRIDKNFSKPLFGEKAD